MEQKRAAGVHSRTVMRARIKAFVGQHLRDADLSIGRMAARFNCTKRYLHKAFDAERLSLTRYIWQLRLEACARDLLDPRLESSSVREIALAWGFRSAPHFSRIFRARFDASPGAFRARRLRAAWQPPRHCHAAGEARVS